MKDGWEKSVLCFVLTVVGAFIVTVLFRPLADEDGVFGFWERMAVIIAMFVVYFFIFIAFRRTVSREDYCFKIRPDNTLVAVMIALICLLSFILVQFGAIDLFAAMGVSMDSEPFYIDTWGMYIMAVFAMAILPAVVEELLFRGVIFKSLKKYGPLLAILLSSLLFAMYHLNPMQLVYQFVMGVVFSVVYLKTNNLLYPIILHFVNNFAIVTYTFIAANDHMPYTWNAFTIITTILLAIVGTAAIISLITILKREERIGTTKAQG